MLFFVARDIAARSKFHDTKDTHDFIAVPGFFQLIANGAIAMDVAAVAQADARKALGQKNRGREKRGSVNG